MTSLDQFEGHGAHADQARTSSSQVRVHPDNHDDGDAYHSDSDSSSVSEHQDTRKEKSRKPGNSAFRQQRLKAYSPVFTASNVIPLLLILAIVFVPLGAAMWYASDRVQDLAINYAHCEKLASADHWSAIPDEYLDYHLKDKSYKQPQWRLSKDESQQFEDESNVCEIQFNVPRDLKGPIYFFYRLEKFYANHRRFVKSYSEEQIIGHAASKHTVKETSGQNCQPMSTHKGKIIYPCGLIANSMFNDTFSSTLSAVNGTADDYKLTNKGIAWSKDKNRFKKTKYSHKDIVPPPNWYKRFPNGYNETNVPDVSTWEEFQNWMHPAGLPTFNKLVLRNDDDTLKAGTYQVSVGLHWPVLPFKGGKYIYISQRSVMGGKNPFVGIAWMASGGVCFVLSIFLLVVNLVKPRKTGDMSLLSWNREKAAEDEKAVEQSQQ
ncbi:alkylphosphocholine resistance protein lem3 [Yamadazyma tenuis]|uniref:Lem3/Cdc50 n=1 Tax=Candida tenuis (strain ATCC 10573 / BCRC 21748 / CBS 615 / JCM 9827 / NBRC 10315 / NRRL Y-1498 / VKM Y-70) TaxID=590646 RepID=G3B4P9_CANTC|nr:Lem3/Cdc50 [Yamadazyma tenuis ATCC 10573]XP_006686634.1 uncharacterized protein CANTEDRAFT_114028 [Yamadazyma tenuis ATCC 10573]EGV64319.1 Lem3/Cdc50 [Yamadazyma tenuis ATCC 10573]EGV64320.1 hypothetical protein CANTEDRAFT_114028 [Yamadazyma tenuis ATCC 10573]WEJ96382.1 alkylphosphocholine resistance protein lem3 [Yamadazyma tenuis]